MEKIEKYIKLEILGSKRKARYYTVKELFKTEEYKTECNDFLLLYNLTIDHIFLISDLKEYGNISAYPSDKTDFENILLSLCHDDDDKHMVKDLLKYLELKNPYDVSTGLWNILNPY